VVLVLLIIVYLLGYRTGTKHRPDRPEPEALALIEDEPPAEVEAGPEPETVARRRLWKIIDKEDV